MKTFLFQHRVINSRYCLVSAENTKVVFPSLMFWEHLGIVDIKNLFLQNKLKQKESSLEIDEEMFDIVPEINQLVNP